MADKRYYWLKLKRDFFKRHDIRIIEAMPNGKEYLLFYLKLLCESVDHDGKLRFSDEIPYTTEMLATITGTNVDVSRNACKIFSDLGMMELLDDGTILLKEVSEMVGSETEAALKKRLQRGQCRDNVGTMSLECPDNVQESKIKSKSKSKSKRYSYYLNNGYNFLSHNARAGVRAGARETGAIGDFEKEAIKKTSDDLL